MRRSLFVGVETALWLLQEPHSVKKIYLVTLSWLRITNERLDSLFDVSIDGWCHELWRSWNRTTLYSDVLDAALRCFVGDAWSAIRIHLGPGKIAEVSEDLVASSRDSLHVWIYQIIRILSKGRGINLWLLSGALAVGLAVSILFEELAFEYFADSCLFLVCVFGSFCVIIFIKRFFA